MVNALGAKCLVIQIASLTNLIFERHLAIGKISAEAKIIIKSSLQLALHPPSSKATFS